MEALLVAAYPEHQWDTKKFSVSKNFAPQLFMERIIKTIFLQHHSREIRIEKNVRDKTRMRGERGMALELDVFLPDLNIAFEYQDPHHYFHTVYGATELKRDREKQRLAAAQGITLINVPFWWDWNTESLIATIKEQRPDLLSSVSVSCPPIAQDPPSQILDKYDFEIPDLGVPMFAMYIPKAINFDPNNWWVFEKYDGMRAIWNGTLRTLYSRWASPLSLPFYLSDSLSSFLWLDGEIWFGRKPSTRIEAMKGKLEHISWNNFQLMVFDAPNPKLRSLPYESRYQFLKDNFTENCDYVKLAPYEVCGSKADVEAMYFKYRSMGGEGVIVRDPTAPYMHGYSPYLFKHRGVHDAEALIVHRKSDTVFLCRINQQQLVHNAKFDNSTSVEDEKKRDKDTEDKFMEVEIELDDNFEGDKEQIQAGTFVSFKYSGLQTASLEPISPKIYVTRTDISTWNQVLHSKKKNVHQRIWTPPNQQNDWKDKDNHRKYFIEIAKKRKFDPLVAENWYIIDRKDLPNSSGLLQYYNNSYISALTSVFPEVHFDPASFKFVPQNFWNSKENRKQFFDYFAKAKSIDPLISSNWYSFSPKEFSSFKGGNTVLSKYDFNLCKALSDVYPFVQFDEIKFDHLPVKFWQSKDNVRKLLDMFAKEKGFDPLVADNWYAISSLRGDDISSFKHGSSALSGYNGSIINALKDAYPDVNFQTTNFSFVTKNFWATQQNRRQFFEDYAKNMKFNPLVANNWYSVTLDNIYKEKRAGSVLHYYNNSLKDALIDAFPEVKFNLEKFTMSPKNHWMSLQNRKSFFDEYAKSNKFNPSIPSNWYSVTAKSILAVKGGSSIMVFYKQSLVNALLEVYPNIGLRESKFFDLPVNYFSQVENRRKFFEEFAKDKKFDPLISSNWTDADVVQALNIQNHAKEILSFYNTWEIALKYLYPHLNLENFPQPSNEWESEDFRKKIFEGVAKSKNFNPLVADNWYYVSDKDVLKQKGGAEVMKYYGNSILRAVHELYNFTLSKTKYRVCSKVG